MPTDQFVVGKTATFGLLLKVKILRSRYLGEPHTRSTGWLDVCRHPHLLDAIEACIGHDIVLVFSSFFIKPADGKDGEGNEALVSWSVLSTD